jgi:hypothetical protein
MTTATPRPTFEQVQDLIESTIRARRQIGTIDLGATISLPHSTLLGHLRKLQADSRIHSVRVMGKGRPRGGIWAAGPAPIDEAEEDAVEPLHLFTKRWTAPKVRFSPLELCLFGRAPVEVRV